MLEELDLKTVRNDTMASENCNTELQRQSRQIWKITGEMSNSQ
jgi:hypothetical protein